MLDQILLTSENWYGYYENPHEDPFYDRIILWTNRILDGKPCVIGLISSDIGLVNAEDSLGFVGYFHKDDIIHTHLERYKLRSYS